MAGSIDLGPSKGGKKPLDVNINVIPIIDLMAVTISFLLLTAAWNQIGRLQVSQSGGAASESTEESKTTPVTLLVTDGEARLSIGAAPPEVFPLTKTGEGKKVDLTGLGAALKKVKANLPEQNIITVQAEDAVRYEDLVHIIDECMGAGLSSVSVQAAVG